MGKVEQQLEYLIKLINIIRSHLCFHQINLILNIQNIIADQVRRVLEQIQQKNSDQLRLVSDTTFIFTQSERRTFQASQPHRDHNNGD